MEERGRHVTANVRDWLDAQLRAWLSIWEVLDVEPGKSIRLKDVLTGEERLVSEVVGSRDMTRHLLLLARVVDHAGLSLLVGMHPNPLPPEAGSEVVDDVRAEFGLGKRVASEEMRKGDRPTDLIEIWEEMIAHIESRPLPQLRNTDGEELVFIEDHYKLVGRAARSTLETELAKLPDVEAPEDDEPERRYRVIRASGEQSRMGNTVMASIVVKPRTVVVEANSYNRADGLRNRLQAAFGDILRFDHRQQKSVEEAMAKGAGSARNAPPQPVGPEVDALLRAVKAQHYDTWSDHSLPALDGLTPREAASQAKYRSRVDRLLKEMESDPPLGSSRRHDGPFRILVAVRMRYVAPRVGDRPHSRTVHGVTDLHRCANIIVALLSTCVIEGSASELEARSLGVGVGGVLRGQETKGSVEMVTGDGDVLRIVGTAD
jgi:hypothetical protein